jgi:hypothetical protein
VQRDIIDTMIDGLANRALAGTCKVSFFPAMSKE